jgi:hypothetical protein
MFGNKESNRLSIHEQCPKLILVAVSLMLSQLALFNTYGNLYATSNEDDNRELGIQCETGSEDVCLVDACMGHPCVGYNNYNGGFERDFDVAITKHTTPDLNYLDKDSASSTLQSAADDCLESSSNIQYISTNGLGNSNDDDDNDDDGTVFAKLLDNDYDTKWQEQGFGSFIQMDLGSVETVCSLGIAWDKGDERSYNFIISTSNDGTTFTDVLRGTSSGSTEAIEKYDLADDQSRFIRVTVFGNDDESDDEHDTAAINEIRVGTSTASPISHNSPSNEQLVLSQPTSNVNNSVASTTNSTEITPDSYLSKLTDIMKTDRLQERTQNQFIDTNLAPSVEDLNIRAASVSSVEIELNGTDPNSAAQSLEFSVNDLPTHGVLKPGPSQDSVLYYPNPGFVGPDSFTYRAIDDQGLESALGTAHIAIEN